MAEHPCDRCAKSIVVRACAIGGPIPLCDWLTENRLAGSALKAAKLLEISHMGRPKKSIAMKKVLGTNRLDRPGKPEAAPIAPGIPEPPAGLSPAALVQFRLLTGDKAACGTLSLSDGVMLGLAASLAADALELRARIASDGRFHTTAAGVTRAHPGIAVLGGVERRLQAALIALGLCAAGRSKLAPVDLPPAPAHEISRPGRIIYNDNGVPVYF